MVIESENDIKESHSRRFIHPMSTSAPGIVDIMREGKVLCA